MSEVNKSRHWQGEVKLTQSEYEQIRSKTNFLRRDPTGKKWHAFKRLPGRPIRYAYYTALDEYTKPKKYGGSKLLWMQNIDLTLRDMVLCWRRIMEANKHLFE